MSTVLWANLLIDGAVRSEAVDRYALYRHGRKLDALGRRSGPTSLLALCDSTDARIQVEDVQLPPEHADNDAWMAAEGVWIDTTEAVDLLARLLDQVERDQTRFGMIRNQHAEVVLELREVLAFARTGLAEHSRFNFSVVL